MSWNGVSVAVSYRYVGSSSQHLKHHQADQPPPPPFSCGPRPQPALASQPALRSIPFSSFTNKPHPSTTSVFPSPQLTLSHSTTLSSLTALLLHNNLLRSLSLPSSTPPKEASPSPNQNPLPLLTRRSPSNTAVVVIHLPLYSFPPTPWTNKSATIPLVKSL